MRERRARFAGERGLVDDLIVVGTQRTRREARQTLAAIREAMGLSAVFAGFRRNTGSRPVEMSPESVSQVVDERAKRT